MIELYDSQFKKKQTLSHLIPNPKIYSQEERRQSLDQVRRFANDEVCASHQLPPAKAFALSNQLIMNWLA